MNYTERIYSESEIKLINEIFDMTIKQVYDEDLKKIIIDCKEMFLENQKSLKEIERLNNIINELEKWLRSEIKRIEELQNPAKSKIKPYGEEYNNYTLIIGAYDNALDKLQELKGSVNNDN